VDESSFCVRDQGVLLDPHAEPNSFGFQIGKPGLADEFAVAQEALDLLFSENCDKSLDQRDALGGIGISPLVEKHPHDRDADPFIRNHDHEDVDILLSEFPVGPINRQRPRGVIDREQRY
jgi:hypothetical protein